MTDIDGWVREIETADGTPLDRLEAASRRATDLETAAELLLDHFVNAARDAGCTWAQIGERLGVTRQAAQQRFVATPPPRHDPKFFVRFSAPGRAVVDAAQEEAHRLAHHYLGTEHLLLGVLRTSEPLARGLGVGLRPARARVEDMIGRGRVPRPGAQPFTPRAKKVLEMALRECVALRDGHIDAHHILLALSAEGEGVASQVLRDIGLDDATVRARVGDVIGREVPPPCRRRGRLGRRSA